MRMTENHPLKILYLNNNRFQEGVAVTLADKEFSYCHKKTPTKSVFVYNLDVGKEKPFPDKIEDKTLADKINDLNADWSHAFRINTGDFGISKFLDGYLAQILVLPDTFEDDYASFCSSNKKLINNMENKYASRYDSIVKYIYCLCDGSKNYFFWAVGLHFNCNITFFTIKRIIDWVTIYPQLVKNLSKGTVTGYVNHGQILNLLDEMQKLRNQKRIKDVINSFNTEQKKLLKDLKLSSKDKDIMIKFGKLSIAKQINFIKKMSSVNDVNEIMAQMGYLVNVHFDWNKDSLLNAIKNSDNLHAEIISSTGNIVLLKVDDYDTIKYLGKSTNWCISKNKTYWNQYVKDNDNYSQYVIFDFSRQEDDKMSIIGFTSKLNRGIVAAHDFNNTNLMTDYAKEDDNNPLTSYLETYNDITGIFSILRKDKINLYDVTKYDEISYEWNKENFIKNIEKYVPKSDYIVIYDSDNKLVLSVHNSAISNIFKGFSVEDIDYDFWANEIIIFADFNLSKNNPNKLLFGSVVENEDSYECNVDKLYNSHYHGVMQSFDSKIEEYGLPYDIICRTDSLFDRFINAISNMEIDIIDKLLKNNELSNAIKKNSIVTQFNKDGIVHNALLTSLFTYNSFDLLKVFYDNGITLTNLMGFEYVLNIFNKACTTILSCVNNHYKNMIVPTPKMIDQFNNGKTDYRTALYIAMFKILDAMIDHEKNIIFCNDLISAFGYEREIPLLTYYFKKLIGYADFKHLHNYMRYVIEYGFMFKIDEIIKVTLENATKSPLKELVEDFERQYGLNHMKLVTEYSKR